MGGGGPEAGGDGSQVRLRGDNRARVVGELRRGGPRTRAELVTATGLSRTTISSLVGELLESGYATEVDAADDGGARAGAGRPSRVVRLDPRAGAAVSIDVGARHVAVALGDLGHRVLARRWSALEHGHTVEVGAARASELLDEVLAEAGLDRELVIGAAVGLPAPISQPGGLVASSSILPGWAGIPIADRLTELLGLEVFVDNDANLGALAESVWGAGRGAEEIAYIKVATGIGAGLLFGGRLFRGNSGTAGEIGHMTVAEDGPVCRCGNRGCLELYAGGIALLAALRSSAPQIDTVEALVEAAHDGDPAAVRMVADAGRHIGAAIASLVNLLGPQRIIVGGELSDAGDLLLDPMREAVSRSAIHAAVESVEIVAASLGAGAEVLGGLVLVAREPERFGADRLLSLLAPS